MVYLEIDHLYPPLTFINLYFLCVICCSLFHKCCLCLFDDVIQPVYDKSNTWRVTYSINISESTCGMNSLIRGVKHKIVIFTKHLSCQSVNAYTPSEIKKYSCLITETIRGLRMESSEEVNLLNSSFNTAGFCESNLAATMRLDKLNKSLALIMVIYYNFYMFPFVCELLCCADLY